MSVLGVDEERGHGSLVHSYAVAGGDLKEHIKYLYYLQSAFDFDMICIDNAGFQFIDSCNETKWFQNDKINLKFIEFNSDKEGLDYDSEIKKLKLAHDKGEGKVVFKQNFSSSFIRKANEHLQACIDHKKIWFASKTVANPEAFSRYSSQRVTLKNIPEPTILEFIESQDALIYQTKKQCTLVEVKTTARGTQTFDLPQHLKRSTSASRARKDNYTTLMLANWGSKCYFDMMDKPVEDNTGTFVPRMI